jgi:hypothetical protein
MPFFIPLICLMAIGVAVFQRSAQAVPADPAVPDDIPLQLLRWAVGLLSAQRDEWGQAMLGELACIDGRARRWRFSLGCVGAALLLPPWGRAAAAVWVMVAVAAGAVGPYAYLGARYGLEGGDWVYAAIAAVLLAGYILTASVLLRQRGVAVPGLLGGLVVALMWLLLSGKTFYDVISQVTGTLATLLLVVVVPLAVGVAGTVWGGGAAAGRRIARLAGISAGLCIFLYGTIAVVAFGTGGPPGDPGCTGRCLIGDRLDTNAIFDLWLLPLTTAAIGWAAAAATARVRPRPAAGVVPVPFPAAGLVGTGGRHGVTVHGPSGTGRPRTVYRLLVWAVVVIALGLLALGMLAG